MKNYLFLIIGGVAGVVARYQIGVWIANWGSPSDISAPHFPWATFLINITGSFVLGFAMRYLLATGASPALRLMLTTGFCGGYTTFSTFSYETMALFQSGDRALALGYLLSSMSLGPLACFGGYLLAGVVSGGG